MLLVRLVRLVHLLGVRVLHLRGGVRLLELMLRVGGIRDWNSRCVLLLEGGTGCIVDGASNVVGTSYQRCGHCHASLLRGFTVPMTAVGRGHAVGVAHSMDLGPVIRARGVAVATATQGALQCLRRALDCLSGLGGIVMAVWLLLGW